MSEAKLTPLIAANAAPRTKPSNYPEPFFSRMAGRVKQPLGDLFGLTNFGVNRSTMTPGSVSALMHAHSTQDEFIYILEGDPILITESGEIELHAGMCAGFKAGGAAHMLVNRGDRDVVYLEIGDRSAGDAVRYPVDDIVAGWGEDGKWHFTHKDGTPY